EKSFLRNAFSHYLSTDVINELITDPEKLNLGGEKKYLTAMFTDVRGFSTVSEDLDPTDLVKLLNAYLTDMSDIILDQKGTIDKYEGDAIISFFGAPVARIHSAYRRCTSRPDHRQLSGHIDTQMAGRPFGRGLARSMLAEHLPVEPFARRPKTADRARVGV
ncbi:hypothetical protein LCGC14_2583540, partial [marine sediment metagenome]